MAKYDPVPPVIDFESILQPISEENPSGESMQYSGLYDEIREARRADDPSLSQGQWQAELKVADYRQVINLAVPALTSKTKDLQVSVWLSEALTSLSGFAGLRDSLRLVRQLEEAFWDTLFPEIDEGDMEGRANAIEWMNAQLSQSLKKIAITAGDGFSFLDWEESTHFDIPEDIESLEYDEREKFQALKTKAENEKRKTGTMWRKAKASTNREFCEILHLTIEECLNELELLDRTNEEKFDRNQVPGVNDLKKSLGSVQTVVAKLLDEKRELEPDAEEESNAEVTEISEEGEVVVKKGPAVATGAIQSRQDALKRLSDVAEYFRKNEPNSPIASIIQRAVKWGNMPFDVLIQDLIKDDSVIGQVRQTLGFNTGDPNEQQ